MYFEVQTVGVDYLKSLTVKSSSVVCLYFFGTAMFQNRTSKEQLAKMSSSVVYEWTKLSEEFLATSVNPRDLDGRNGTLSDVMSVLLGSDIEDSDENEDKESEDFSNDSDSDLGDRPTLTATFINLLTYSPRAMR
ncbi:hypothetical protein E2C01_027430 [Portunus trituberculatus]|uniref:Uncharacterized protein n=1 Tax=Portunus trituberculatus TaxID=210409 RepID=A0A5B7ELB6_PORTR|nr:hypothetical protein [Portunus trituberculatus]